MNTSLAIAINDRARRRTPVVNINRDDPTQTLVLRRQFSAQMTKRFRALKGAINRKIITEDYLGGYDEVQRMVVVSANWEYRWASQKAEGFMGWLKVQQDAGILEMIEGPGLINGAEPWSNTYVRSSYQKGIAQARTNLRRAGAEIPAFATLPGVSEASVAFNQPFHADRLALIYTRVFNELKGVTAAMDQQISRVLTRGMAEGKSPREIARTINDRVDAIGLNRARLIARTEIVHTHNIATLNEYNQASNIIGEEVLVQWYTARDSQVRPHHVTRHEKVYKEEEARGLIGEPNCRCALLPWIPSIQGGTDEALNRVVRTKPKKKKKVVKLKPKSKPKFVALKSMDEVKERFKKLGIKAVTTKDYRSGYKVGGRLTDSDMEKLLSDSNGVLMEFERMIEQTPSLKNRIKRMKLEAIELVNRDTVTRNGAVGLFHGGEKKITMATKEFSGTWRPSNKPGFKKIEPKLARTDGRNIVENGFNGTLRHEMGHYFHSLLATQKKVKWTLNHYNKNGPDYFKANISKYAGTNPSEAFAESFAVFTSESYGKSGLRLPDEIHSYFKEMF